MSVSTARLLGLLGSAIIILGVILPGLLYRGKSAERYSPLNHFISELGELGVSRAAPVFNYSLMLGGLLLVPFNLGLGLQLNSLLGWLGAAAGCLAVLGVAAVGLFPMNRLKAHTLAAMTYFRAGLFMTLFYGLAILFQPAGQVTIPYAVNLLTFLALGSYAAFLIAIRPKKPAAGAAENRALDPLQAPVRPHFWLVPALEWSILFTTMLWLFGTAAVL